MWVDLTVAALVIGLIMYSVLGGADFGAGFWDLTAGGADWLVGSIRTRSVTVDLEQGWHQIRIDYLQYTAEAHLSFRMSPEPEPPVAVPVEALASWAENLPVP